MSKSDSKVVAIPTLNLQKVVVTLIGESPLIMHRFSEKAQRQIQDGQRGGPKVGKQPRDPNQDYENSIHYMPAGSLSKYGFPAVGFKAAAVRAAKGCDMSMTDARTAFHINCDLVPIFGEPRMRTDMVRLNGKGTDIRYRAEFVDWWTQFEVVVNTSVISVDQLLTIFMAAGFGCGVGEWRPEKSSTGSFGRFRIATEADVKRVQKSKAA